VRRNRKVREFREKALKRRSLAEVKHARIVKANARKANNQQKHVAERVSQLQSRGLKFRVPKSISRLISPASSPFKFGSFVNTDDYSYSGSTIRVAHVIESLGLGGAQTMTFELVDALNRYQGKNCINKLVYVPFRTKTISEEMVKSYGVSYDTIPRPELKSYCKHTNVDVVVQHRLAVSKCLKPYLPSKTKYVLVNHTWHSLFNMRRLTMCDLYVSVCQFLDKKTKWLKEINGTRRFPILNGVENDYIDKIKSRRLDGDFITGRCHRLVFTKFHDDYIGWMGKDLSKTIKGHQHYILGSSGKAKYLCKKSKVCNYVGPVMNRKNKMSYIKAFDVYYYETYQHEGASMAILEGLASGVPVLCIRYGGCPELVKNGVNGFVCRDRMQLGAILKDLANDPKKLKKLKESTKEDFDKRLHIRHTSSKYMQLFEALMK